MKRDICQTSEDVKTSAITMLHGTCMIDRKCTLVLISNLAEPDWLSIHCNVKLLQNIICIKREHNI